MTRQKHKPGLRHHAVGASDAPLNPPDVPVEDKQRELEGRRPPDQQAAYLSLDEIDDLGQISSVDIYQAELAAGVNDDLPDDPEQLELLTELELRTDETDNPIEATEEGIPYIPPIDPPTVAATYTDSESDAVIANGYASSALDEPYDQDHHSSFLTSDDEMSARVREALRADSSTTSYADSIGVFTRGGVVTLRGSVDDLIDSDNLAAVAAYVEGVEEVIDELDIRALG